MSKKFLLRLAATSTLFLSTISFAGLGLTAAAEAYQNVKSPNLKGTTECFLMKSDNSGVVTSPNHIALQIEQKDKKIDLTFNYGNSNLLPDLGTGEKYFVVLIEKASGKPIDKQFLTKGSDNKYTCTFEVPFYSNNVEFKVYKQGATDSDFQIKDENLIGKAKYLMVYHSLYNRQADQTVNPVNKNDAAVTGSAEYYLNKLVPNFYSLKSSANARIENKKVAKIVLDDSQKDLLSEEDCIVSGNYFKNGLEANYPNGYFNFYIPKEVRSFKVEVYNDSVADDNFVYQLKIDLNKLDYE